MDTVQSLSVVTTDSISRRTSAVSNKRSRKEDANFKCSSKAKKPVDNQDAKRSREEDANFNSSSKAKQPLGNQDAKELEHISDSYTEGQTSLIEVIPKTSDSSRQLSRDFLAYLTQVQTEVLAEAPLAKEKKKEASRKRKEEIKKMTPEQFKEYYISLVLERTSQWEKQTWF